MKRKQLLRMAQDNLALSAIVKLCTAQRLYNAAIANSRLILWKPRFQQTLDTKEPEVLYCKITLKLFQCNDMHLKIS